MFVKKNSPSRYRQKEASINVGEKTLLPKKLGPMSAKK